MQARGFLGGPVVKTSEPLLQGAWVRSLVQELRSHVQCGMAKKQTKGGGCVQMW